MHVHLYFILKSVKRLRVIDIKTFWPQSAPVQEFRFSGSFFTRGFFFFANTRQTDLETEVLSDDASTSHFQLAFVYFSIITYIAP